MTSGVEWGPTDLTGGPLDEVFTALRRAFPDIHVERLTVTHAADDDNVWFITRAGGGQELQVDSMPHGAPPFLLESDTGRDRADSAHEAIRKLAEWLSG